MVVTAAHGYSYATTLTTPALQGHHGRVLVFRLCGCALCGTSSADALIGEVLAFLHRDFDMLVLYRVEQ